MTGRPEKRSTPTKAGVSLDFGSTRRAVDPYKGLNVAGIRVDPDKGRSGRVGADPLFRSARQTTFLFLSARQTTLLAGIDQPGSRAVNLQPLAVHAAGAAHFQMIIPGGEVERGIAAVIRLHFHHITIQQ